MKTLKSFVVSSIVMLTVVFNVAQAARLPGAIFTTTPDGGIVNENVRYESKPEVYLDGGPGMNAPARAASLPDGLYVFQITDPPGKVLLSEDPSKCRVVEVKNGVINRLVPPTEFGFPNNNYGGSNTPCHIQDEPDQVAGSSAQHDTNTDMDHGSDENAIVVQMMPFFDTPNPGGVYKAWIMPKGRYQANGGNLGQLPKPICLHKKKNTPMKCNSGASTQLGFERDQGFGPARDQVKTDNFKVKERGRPPEPPELIIRKFHDTNLNGMLDANESEIAGWSVLVKDPVTLVIDNFFTSGDPDNPLMVIAPNNGLWMITEEQPAGTLHTVTIVDGVKTLFPNSPTAQVTVIGAKDETHEVIFGDVALGKVTVCKYDGAQGMHAIEGWRVVLSGPALVGGVVQDNIPRDGTTTANGCVMFTDLLPGNYMVEEILAMTSHLNAMWVPLTDMKMNVTINSTDQDGNLVGSMQQVDFRNACMAKGTAQFSTKGYWHNNNGVAELMSASFNVLNVVNALAPYATDQPYSTVVEPFNNFMETSQFLVESNSNSSLYDHKEQLAQQLLAFVFNVLLRVGSFDAVITLPDNTTILAGDLIDQAIAIWLGTNDGAIVQMQELLNTMNNNNGGMGVQFAISLPPGSCDVVYQN